MSDGPQGTYQLSADDLIAFGFREYPPNPEFDRCDRAFQYRRIDENGILYFVQVQFWRHSKYRADVPDGWSADAQLSGVGHRHFNVELLSVAEMRPEDIVAWFDAAWVRMACWYYETWPPLSPEAIKEANRAFA